MGDYSDALDKKYEGLSGDALLDAPIEAFTGIGPAKAAALRTALGVRTIRELADNRFVRLAIQMRNDIVAPLEASQRAVTGIHFVSGVVRAERKGGAVEAPVAAVSVQRVGVDSRWEIILSAEPSRRLRVGESVTYVLDDARRSSTLTVSSRDEARRYVCTGSWPTGL